MLLGKQASSYTNHVTVHSHIELYKRNAYSLQKAQKAVHKKDRCKNRTLSQAAIRNRFRNNSISKNLFFDDPLYKIFILQRSFLYIRLSGHKYETIQTL